MLFGDQLLPAILEAADDDRRGWPPLAGSWWLVEDAQVALLADGSVLTSGRWAPGSWCWADGAVQLLVPTAVLLKKRPQGFWIGEQPCTCIHSIKTGAQRGAALLGTT